MSESGMSGQTPERDAERDAAAAGTTDGDAGNLSVEDDPQGTTDPAELAGSADREDDATS